MVIIGLVEMFGRQQLLSLNTEYVVVLNMK